MLPIEIDIAGKADDEFATVYDFLDKASQEQLQAEACKRLTDYWELTIGQFFAIQDNDLSCIGITEPEKQTKLQYIWLRGFTDFVDKLCNVLKRFEVKQSATEKRASASLIKMSFKEGVIIFLQRYFGLTSFKAAEGITVGELVIAKKSDYNRATFERAMANIQKQQLSKK